MRRRILRNRMRSLRRLGRAMGLAASATLLPAASDALPVNENSYYPASWYSDGFGDSFASSTALPAGTDVVQGAVHEAITCFLEHPECFTEENLEYYSQDWNDYITFTDLAPGTDFSISFIEESSDLGLFIELLDDLENVLASSWISSFGTISSWPTSFTFDGVVPESGRLVVHTAVGQDHSGYRVTLDARYVPEPGTALLLGAGLAALPAGRLRARRKSRD